MHDEDQEAVEAAAKADGPDAETHERGAETRAPDKEARGPDTDLDAHKPADDAQPESVPDGRPVHSLGAVGCLTMALTAVAGMALLATGNSLAVATGIVFIAVAIGVGLWLSNAAGATKK